MDQSKNGSKGSIRGRFSGDYNVICDVCGKKRKFSECTMAYGTGIIPVVMSCSDGCADYNHPLNYPPPIIFDGRPVRDARPEGTDHFVVQTIPSFFTWGHFPGGRWAHFNNGNSEFSTEIAWTWGDF